MLLLLSMLITANAEEKKVRYNKTTEIDFEAIDITGEMVKPQGALINERPTTTFNPLIQLRMDFNQEMSASVNDIK